MEKIRGYVASGSVRGDCGHLHKTAEAAERCRDKDVRACASLPGGNSYSDRHVYAVHGDGFRTLYDPAGDQALAEMVDEILRSPSQVPDQDG